MNKLKNNLAEMLEYSGVSQVELAKRTGLDRTRIVKIANQQAQIYRPEEIWLITEALECDVFGEPEDWCLFEEEVEVEDVVKLPTPRELVPDLDTSGYADRKVWGVPVYELFDIAVPEERVGDFDEALERLANILKEEFKGDESHLVIDLSRVFSIKDGGLLSCFYKELTDAGWESILCRRNNFVNLYVRPAVEG